MVFFGSKKDQGCDSVVIPSCSCMLNCLPLSDDVLERDLSEVSSRFSLS